MCRHILSLPTRLATLGVAFLHEARQMGRSAPLATRLACLTNEEVDAL